MEQEETRTIRTSQWLFMKRIENTKYDFQHELYDLVSDPDERKNLAHDLDYAEVVAELSTRVAGRVASSSPIPRDPFCGKKFGVTTGHPSTSSANIEPCKSIK
jgi:hypothetical protein